MNPPPTGIWRWSDRYDRVPALEHRLSLGEGATPLVRSRHIGPAAGLPHLFFKLELGNPTGSYKDRFAAAAISHMLERGESACVATSSGNTGAALAAYCATARIRCRIAIVEGAPAGKLRQMLAYGAELRRIRGFGIDPAVTASVFVALDELGKRPGHAVQISAYAHSPLGMMGVESIAHELAETLGERLNRVFCPAGGGGLCLAVARGFERGEGRARPAIHCVQPEGNDTMAGVLRSGGSMGRRVDPCTTAISGLQVPTVIDADDTIAACRKSGGTGHLVEDAFVWECQRRLALEEGLFSEPAGAVALAGALRARENGEISGEDTVVCLVTGNGFKDESSLDRMTAHTSAPLVDLIDFELI